jgi:hypothetical protein
MPVLPMEEFFAGAVRGLVDAQLALDDQGRDSIDRFGETGVLPTVMTWSGVRLGCPIAAGLAPREVPGERTEITLAPHGGGMLRLQLRYELADQGDDA